MKNLKDFYIKYYTDLFNYARYLTKDFDHAKDLVSETFYKALIIDTELNTSALKPYLFKILYHLYLDFKKKNSVFNREIVDTQNTELLDKKLEQKELIAEVLNALKKYPDIDQSTFYLKIFSHLNYKEISQITGLSIAAIKVKIYRIRKKLNEDLTHELNR